MAVETELKLQLDPSGLAQLRRHPLVEMLKRGRPTSRMQKSVYFDSDDFRLRAMGAVLRVRHIGKRRIQTVKTMGACIGGAWARDEWECEINGDIPDFVQLSQTPLANLFAAEGLEKSLHPVFTTEIKRTTYTLGDGVWEVELALDEGQLVTAQGSAPICEAELELKAGEPRHLFEIALGLQADLPARLMTATKASRGYRLADGSQPKPQKSISPVFNGETLTVDAFRAIAHSCAAQLLINQDCLIETRDPEAIHQMRVALRRLRSAMSVFKALLDTPQTHHLRSELSWLQSLLGPARDTDVFIDDILTPVADLLAADAGYVALSADFRTLRQTLYDTATAEICDPRFTRLMLELGHWCECGDWLSPLESEHQALLSMPVKSLAVATLSRRHRKVAKGLKHLSSLTPHHRHLVRIEIKKLRYASEFFISLFNEKRDQRSLFHLGALQDVLGLLNDIAVARGALKNRAEESADPERMWASGLICGWHSARIPALLHEAENISNTLKKIKTFWIDERAKK